MSTTKTLSQIAYETQQNLLGDCIIWHGAMPLKRERWEAIANADGMILFRDGSDLWESSWAEPDGAKYWISIPAFFKLVDEKEMVREEFERDAAPFVCDFSRLDGGDYKSGLTQALWTGYKRGWQASRKGAQV